MSKMSDGLIYSLMNSKLINFKLINSKKDAKTFYHYYLNRYAFSWGFV
jgi:hypothetical protein